MDRVGMALRAIRGFGKPRSYRKRGFASIPDSQRHLPADDLCVRKRRLQRRDALRRQPGAAGESDPFQRTATFESLHIGESYAAVEPDPNGTKIRAKMDKKGMAGK